MNRSQKTRKILLTAESGIRSLVADAASAGDYDETLILTNLARSVANLAAAIGPAPEDSPSAKTTNSAITPTTLPAKEKPKAKTATKGRSKRYPKFVKLNGELVKIGWSKSTAKEYQHKAPKNVLHIVAQALRTQRHEDGTLSPPHEFLPLTTAKGETIPDYQSYLCIAWLREIGVVERSGRHGYSVSDPDSIDLRLEQAWNQLS